MSQDGTKVVVCVSSMSSEKPSYVVGDSDAMLREHGSENAPELDTVHRGAEHELAREENAFFQRTGGK